MVRSSKRLPILGGRHTLLPGGGCLGRPECTRDLQVFRGERGENNKVELADEYDPESRGYAFFPTHKP